MTIGSTQEMTRTDASSAPSYGVSWLMRKFANVGQIRLITPGRGAFLVGVPKYNQSTPTIEVLSLPKIIRQGGNGIIGWAEAYIDGHWQTPDLRELVVWAMKNEKALEKAFQASWVSRQVNRLVHLLNHNSKRGSRRNIAAHYDLGNEFYQHWLDDSMTYSSALFNSEDETLEQAQVNKNQVLLDMLDLEPGHSVLEIGCGWGGFARALSERGAHAYKGITLSHAQLKYAQEQSNKDQAFQLQDYRDLGERHDRIVSIEMFEAVGEALWDTYFSKLYETLKPGGVAVIQVITIADDRFASYRKNVDFIQKYIFPGGMLPSDGVLKEKIFEAGLQLEEQKAFGKDYARTLADWYQRFNQAWPHINEGRFDNSFRNMWNFYLAYCESGFHSGSTDVRLYKMRKPL